MQRFDTVFYSQRAFEMIFTGYRQNGAFPNHPGPIMIIRTRLSELELTFMPINSTENME